MSAALVAAWQIIKRRLRAIARRRAKPVAVVVKPVKPLLAIAVVKTAVAVAVVKTVMAVASHMPMPMTLMTHKKSIIDFFCIMALDLTNRLCDKGLSLIERWTTQESVK
jgi:hypothetical protein